MLFRSRGAASLLLVLLGAGTLQSQDRLKSMRGYDQYQRMAPLIRAALGGPGGFGMMEFFIEHLVINPAGPKAH